jgi:hypothetical protein
MPSSSRMRIILKKPFTFITEPGLSGFCGFKIDVNLIF